MISNNSSMIKMSKQEIRKIFKNIKREESISPLIKDLIKELKIKNICIYSPFPYEIKIEDFKNYLKKEKIDIYYPYVKRVDDKIFMEIRKDNGNVVKDELSIDSYLGKEEDESNIDAFLIPGLAYNRKGYRLGHGGGFYDMKLADYEGIKIGACYSDNIIDDDFQEAHDIKVDYIVTEKEIIKINR